MEILLDTFNDRVLRTEYFAAPVKKSDACVVVFPGGGYGGHADHEGKGYAEMLNKMGIDALVVYYAVAPLRFPNQLIDARTAIRYVRKNAEKFQIDPNKIAVIGSSAGGHLAAMVSTFLKDVPGDFDTEIPFLPNAQILCYPVICAPYDEVAHDGSYINLLGEEKEEKMHSVDPVQNCIEKTPMAFIWHTADDDLVNVINSYRYGTKLRECGVSHEMHIFPHGYHGLGVATGFPHVAQWVTLLENWLKNCGWLS